MRTLPAFALHRPRILDEALRILAGEGPDARVIAGGTDLVPNLQNRLLAPRHVVSLGRCAELREIALGGAGELRLGALATIRALERSPLLRERYSVLARAAASISTPTLRRMGTLGGNLCLDTRCQWYNQSLAWREGCGFCLKKDGEICHVARSSPICVAAYSADLAPALLALDASVVLRSSCGERALALAEFFVDDGTVCSVKRPDEVIVEVRIPSERAGLAGAYRKVRARSAIDFPLAGVAAAGRIGAGGVFEDVAIAVTGVAPRPLRLDAAGEAVRGRRADAELCARAAELAWDGVHPLHTGGAYSPGYRRLRVRVETRRALAAIAGLE